MFFLKLNHPLYIIAEGIRNRKYRSDIIVFWSQYFIPNIEQLQYRWNPFGLGLMSGFWILHGITLIHCIKNYVLVQIMKIEIIIKCVISTPFYRD